MMLFFLQTTGELNVTPSSGSHDLNSTLTLYIIYLKPIPQRRILSWHKVVSYACVTIQNPYEYGCDYSSVVM